MVANTSCKGWPPPVAVPFWPHARPNALTVAQLAD